VNSKLKGQIRYYLDIFLEELKRTTKDVSQETQNDIPNGYLPQRK
jgi:hypothetical protein